MVDTPEIIEVKAKSNRKQQYQQKLLDVFTSELAVLLKERKDNEQDLTVRPMEIPPAFDSNYFEDCVVQDEDYIEGEMLKRLQSQGIRISRWQIRDYLKAMTKQAKESSSYSALNYAPIKKAEKKRGRKPKSKQGKPKRVGQYKSIKEASLHDNQRSYAALRQKLWRQEKENAL